MASAGADLMVKLWDARTFRLLRSIEIPTAIISVRLSDSSLVVVRLAFASKALGFTLVLRFMQTWLLSTSSASTPRLA